MVYSVPGLQRSLRTVIAAVGAFFLAQYFHFTQPYWMMLSAVFIVQLNLNDRLLKNLAFMLATGLLIALNTTIANSLSNQFPWIALYGFFITLVCFNVGMNKPGLFVAAFIINLFGLIATSGPCHTLDCATAILLGTLLAIIIRALFWPKRLTTRLYEETTEFLNALNQLQQTLFLIYSKRDYLLQHLSYEKELHEQREIIFKTTERLRYFFKKLPEKSSKRWQKYFNHLENLFDLIIALGNLRYRVKDHTTFEICEKEFKNISVNLSVILTQITKGRREKNPVKLDLAPLSTEIQSFEEMNRGALQMVVPDPVIFLVFIQNLQAISRELSFLAVNNPYHE